MTHSNFPRCPSPEPGRPDGEMSTADPRLELRTGGEQGIVAGGDQRVSGDLVAVVAVELPVRHEVGGIGSDELGVHVAGDLARGSSDTPDPDLVDDAVECRVDVGRRAVDGVADPQSAALDIDLVPRALAVARRAGRPGRASGSCRHRSRRGDESFHRRPPTRRRRRCRFRNSPSRTRHAGRCDRRSRSSSSHAFRAELPHDGVFTTPVLMQRITRGFRAAGVGAIVRIFTQHSTVNPLGPMLYDDGTLVAAR